MKPLGRPRTVNSIRSERQYARKRGLCVEYLGGVCVDCGLDDRNPEALQFSHNDPATKEFNIAANVQRRWEVLEPELDKCSLRCRPCHLAYDNP